jgi:hypothetical protein
MDVVACVRPQLRRNDFYLKMLNFLITKQILVYT